MKTIHLQTGVRTQHGYFMVDSGISKLIKFINDTCGVETFASCQGGEPFPQIGQGYVSIGGPRLAELLPKLASGILQEHSKWKQRHDHDCHGCRAMTVALEVNNCGVCIRWMTWDYKTVWRIFKKCL